ncbi:helix-turn-helix domain-containing protein [Paracoccus marcusii]|jgi:excisionase family DNA binding protein|uniref:helix-turn-helix domain-containing protein n=1 Tax=Paracoccus marcusii TaxID=59779 RepID=UPI002491B090|nr:helix-turn-helix domain-containing protein [Paracoccus marcusii]
MTVTTLTPQQAAARAKVSRGTIMNALKEGALTGFRDNRNRWQIKLDDLSKWLSNRTDNASGKGDSSGTYKTPSMDENTLRIAVLEAEIKGKDQRISDLERDRDDWKAQAQDLARRDTSSVPLTAPPRRRWWQF